MNEMGMALMGTGIGEGEARAIDAATKAISSPLLEDLSIKGATGILINITGGTDMTLHEISEASKIIQEEAHEDANILFGAVIDEEMTGEMRVTVIATGFNKPIGKQLRHGQALSAQAGTHATYTSSPQHLPMAATAGTLPARPAVASSPEMRQQPTLGLQMASPMPQRNSSFPAGATRHAQHAVAMASLYENPSARGTVPEAKNDLKEIVREIGVLEYQTDEYDIPTFLRKQAD